MYPQIFHILTKVQKHVLFLTTLLLNRILWIILFQNVPNHYFSSSKQSCLASVIQRFRKGELEPLHAFFS